jgi:hypothetical protein
MRLIKAVLIASFVAVGAACIAMPLYFPAQTIALVAQAKSTLLSLMR